MFDQAIKRAKKLDDYFNKHETTQGPLHGLPISLKDQIYVKGVDTTMGYIGWIDTYEGEKILVKYSLTPVITMYSVLLFSIVILRISL